MASATKHPARRRDTATNRNPTDLDPMDFVWGHRADSRRCDSVDVLQDPTTDTTGVIDDDDDHPLPHDTWSSFAVAPYPEDRRTRFVLDAPADMDDDDDYSPMASQQSIGGSVFSISYNHSYLTVGVSFMLGFSSYGAAESGWFDQFVHHKSDPADDDKMLDSVDMPHQVDVPMARSSSSAGHHFVDPARLTFPHRGKRRHIEIQHKVKINALRRTLVDSSRTYMRRAAAEQCHSTLDCHCSRCGSHPFEKDPAAGGEVTANDMITWAELAATAANLLLFASVFEEMCIFCIGWQDSGVIRASALQEFEVPREGSSSNLGLDQASEGQHSLRERCLPVSRWQLALPLAMAA